MISNEWRICIVWWLFTIYIKCRNMNRCWTFLPHSLCCFCCFRCHVCQQNVNKCNPMFRFLLLLKNNEMSELDVQISFFIPIKFIQTNIVAFSVYWMILQLLLIVMRYFVIILLNLNVDSETGKFVKLCIVHLI